MTTTMSRREALKRVLSSSPILASALSLAASGKAAAQQAPSDFKALVYVFLFGGNDSFNMLTPISPWERESYVKARGGLFADGGVALNTDELWPIDDLASGRRFGLHPAMQDVQTIYEQGNLGFVCNVGSLVRPTTLADFRAGIDQPLGLFSHSDLQRHWMSSFPQSDELKSGWLGRIADWNQTQSSPSSFSMNIGLHQSNLAQTGAEVGPFVIGSTGALEVQAYGSEQTVLDRVLTRSLDHVIEDVDSNRFRQIFAARQGSALRNSARFNQIVFADESIDLLFPQSRASRFQQSLRMVARCIANHEALGHTRQTFLVGIGGWDTHENLQHDHTTNLQQLSRGLFDFYSALHSLGLGSQVVTFTGSDFARTLTSNGRGTDHAWGGNQLVMSEDLDGYQTFGQYPTQLDNVPELDLGRGRLLPTTSTDEMYFELARWFGVPDSEVMETLMPNIRNFVPMGSSLPLAMFL